MLKTFSFVCGIFTVLQICSGQRSPDRNFRPPKTVRPVGNGAVATASASTGFGVGIAIVGSPHFHNEGIPDLFNPYLLPKLSNFGKWFQEYKDADKPDLDNLQILTPEVRTQSSLFRNGMRAVLITTDTTLKNFGSNLQSQEILTYPTQNMLVAKYVAENVSYTGNFSCNGTLFNNTITIHGEGQFHVKLDYICSVFVPITTETYGSGILVNVTDSESSVRQGGVRCNAMMEPVLSEFPGILNNVVPEIKPEKKPSVERFLYYILGRRIALELNRQVGLQAVEKQLGLVVRKQIEEALKDTTIFDILDAWKPQPANNFV